MSAGDLDPQRLFTLQGKVALVTGGSRGIGYMISQGLLQAGARVYITARKVVECRKAAEQLARYGDCRPVPGDVVDEVSRAALVAQVQASEGRLHILVNTAGTAWADD